MHHHLLEASGTKTISTNVIPLRNADNYALPNPRTELFKKSPLYALPLEWNNLDENRYIQNRATFKTSLKYNLHISLMGGAADHGIEPWPAIGN
jgi:hypothetical protein